MKIHDNSDKLSSLSRIKKRIGVRRFIIALFIVIALGGFGFGCIIYGAYLNQTSQTSVLKLFLIRVSEFDFSFIPKFTTSKTVKIDNLDIDIKFKNWEKIRYLRERALDNGRITTETEEEVTAKIRYNDHTYRVDISLTGMTGEHIRHPVKWSLAVKVKDGETIMGMKKFALLVTQSRGYLTDWIATKLMQSMKCIGLRSDFVNVNINGKNHGIYYLEERFDKRLIENNQNREGIVFQADDYGSGIKAYGLKTIQQSEELSSQLARLKKLWHMFLIGEIEPKKILDIKKFASIFVISDIMNQKHALFFMNMRLYFNPNTSMIEPIGREWGYLRKTTYTNPSLSIGKPVLGGHVAVHENTILNRIIDNYTFEEEYLRQLDVLSNRQYLDSIIDANREELNSMLHKIHLQNPFYNFPIDLLYKNQDYLRKSIYPHIPLINVYFDSVGSDSIYLLVENSLDLPIEIHSLRYNNKPVYLNTRKLIKSNFKSEKSFQNLTIDCNSIIDLNSFSVDSLEVIYGILGLDHIKSTIVFSKPITQKELSIINPTSQSQNLAQFDFLTVDQKNKKISFSEGLCFIDKDLIIPKGYIVSAKPGCEIDLSNSSRIISYSPLRFYGKKDSLITVVSNDSTGQGMVVYNCEKTSELSYVLFKHLSNISDIGWDLRGAVTFYNSPVNISDCEFIGNLKGDDFLNIVKTNFNIVNTLFENIIADAFDADFCSGTINNVKFLQVGNDAIDVSGTTLEIYDLEIINAGDKAISGGEGSILFCEDITIEGGEIAIASKDNATVKLNNIAINGSKVAYCAFQKKSEFGPGEIVAYNSTVTSTGLQYLIEVGSYLSIDGKIIEEKSDSVKELLYGAEYGKSSGR